MRVDPRKPLQVKIGGSYDVLSRPVDWQRGFTTFYFGVRRKGLSNAAYEKGMSRHVEMVKRGFYRQGMQGYLILVTDKYEIAYQNWKSQAHFQRAMQSKAGKIVQQDANKLLKTFMFQPAKTFDGSAKPNQAINFRFLHR